MSQNDDSGIDKFLTDVDEPEEGVEYIKPDIELKLPAHKRNECREIVQEIKNFGATGQRQLLYLIYLLSLEIEDIETMRGLVAACKQGRKELPEEKKLIIPD
jgi:hypothetical protein